MNDFNCLRDTVNFVLFGCQQWFITRRGCKLIGRRYHVTCRVRVGEGLYDSNTRETRSANYLLPIRPKLMAMSSFLMNPSSYTEPKFPPTEEYTQSSYIPTHGADFYRASFSNFGYNTNSESHRRYDEGKSPNGSPFACNSVSQGHSNAGSCVNGYSQPSMSPSPPSVATHCHPPPSSISTGGSGSSPPNTCAQEKNGGQPIIYPWMRKSQTTAGEKYVP